MKFITGSKKIQTKTNHLRTITAAISLAFAAQIALAVDPFTVRDIKIEGLNKVEPGTIFASLPVRVGETYTDTKGTAAIRSLYSLGLFSDVRLETQGNVLVVIVQERPTVASIEFSGNREFTTEVLQNALKASGLTQGHAFDSSIAERAEQEIKRQYINRSLYAAQIQTTVTPMEKNQVRLTFNITEGVPTRIKSINITGNKVFTDSKLKDLFDLDAGNWLSWYTKSDQYSRAKLNADLETLRSYYLDRGYINFTINSAEVAISTDRQSIDINIDITEGARFAVSKVTLSGNYLDKEEQFKSLITIKSGQAYSAADVAQTTKAITDHFGTYGYAFASVKAVPTINKENNTVEIDIQAQPSQRAYVRRIHIEGNTKTRDEVIRREMRQYESSWYDADKIKLSRDRIDRLGYFTEINFDTKEVAGAPDQVDLIIQVKEKPTGNITIGAGYSSAEKLSLTFGLSQENIFGSGNRLDLQLNTGKYNRTLVVSTTDPYFTDSGISRTLDFYYRTQRPYQDQGGNYTLVTMGAGLRFGLPITEIDTVYLGINAERIRIKTGTNIPAAYLTYAEKFGYTSTSFPFTLGWARDSRDSALVPTTGRMQRLMAELSLLGDAKYAKANYQFQQYIPLNKQYTLAFNAEAGWGKGLGGKPFPVFKNFYSGGLGSVRGYEQSTLGPRDITGSFIGGTRKFTLNTEFITPFPGAGNDRTLRLYGFFDIGALYGENQKITKDGLRYSVGVGLSWISPIGPLRFSIASPLKKKAGDRIEKFQFQIGTSF